MAGNPSPPPSDAGFEVVRKGYDQGQVDAHLRRLDAEVSILVTDRDAALAQAAQLARELDEARVRAEKLRAQVRTLASPQQGPQAATERIRSMLRLAEDEVADMLSRAETEANRRTKEAEALAAQTLAAAQADADAIRDEGRTDAEKMRQELEQERAAFALERDATLERLAAERTSTEAELAARTAAAEEQQARAWAESEARRKLVEDDFTVAMDQRRAESLSVLAAQHAAAIREAEQLREAAAAQAREVIARAEEQARERIAGGQRRVDELVAVRARMAEQLGRTRAMLDDTLDSLTLPPEQLIPTARTADGVATALSDGHRSLGGESGDDPADHFAASEEADESVPADGDGDGIGDEPADGRASQTAARIPAGHQSRRSRAGSTHR
jgi:cell division septum initiation protein DivIVA